MNIWPITEKQFNYLKPALPDKIKRTASTVKDSFYFVGTHEEYEDIKRRLIYLD